MGRSSLNVVTIYVDEKEYQVDENKNLIDALKDIQIEVPHFCYHPKLSIVGMCRICLIEIEGVSKLQPACNTKIQEGLKIKVASERSIKAREGVMEFLLINHPLDCPVCDKSGECQLQDYSFAVGSETTRYNEIKRSVPQESIGSNLLINHDRCILCYRCVRFDREIIGVHDLEFEQRGGDTIIAYTSPDKKSKQLEHNYQGALSDICPVGALLNKNTLFTSRVWWFEQNQSICHGCSQLCHITANHKKNELYRYMPPEKEENGYFICDQGRFSCSEFSKDRLFYYSNKGETSTLVVMLPKIQEKIDNIQMNHTNKILWLGGTIDSNEEIDELLALKAALNKKGKNIHWEYRTEDYMWQNKWEEQIDFLYMRDQRPNSKKCRNEKIECFNTQDEMKKSLRQFDLIFILNEFSSPYAYLSNNRELLYKNSLYQMIEMDNLWNRVVSFSTHKNEASEKALFSAPIKAFPEKNAHFTDKDGKVKKANQSIKPPKGLLSSVDIIKYAFKFNLIDISNSLQNDCEQNEKLSLEESMVLKV